MPKPTVKAVIIIVKTFQFNPSIAIEPTTHDPAIPTGNITTSDCPNLLVNTNNTKIDTIRLTPVDSTCETTNPENILWIIITSPPICTFPLIYPSDSIKAACFSNSSARLDVCSLVSAMTSTLIFRYLSDESSSVNATCIDVLSAHV